MEYNINDKASLQKKKIVESFGGSPNSRNISWTLGQDTELCFLSSGRKDWTNTFYEDHVVMTYGGSETVAGVERKPRKVIFQRNENGGLYKFIGIFELEKHIGNSFFFKKTGESVRTEDYAGVQNRNTTVEQSSKMTDLPKIKAMPDEDPLLDLLTKNQQLILTGAPGTGKTYTAKKLAVKIVGEGKKENIRTVQFHPSYDYSDFIVGLKPDLEPGSKKKQISFDWKAGIFKSLCDKASTSGENFVMIIDEINRADISRVFGEAFSCLEGDYREDKINLPSGEEFTIPKNVYIIGTMNDIDRSVESMDFALRRRFAWHEVKAEDTGKQIIWSSNKVSEADKETALNKMNKVNEALKPLGFGEAYKLGGAYFKKIEKYASAPGNKWDSLWDNHIAVILREYLRGRRNAGKDLKTLREAYDKAGAGSAPKNESEASIQQNNAGQ